VYTFDDLAPGQYTVSATANHGLAFTRTGDGNILRNLSGGAGESEPVALKMGADLTGLDIGMITPGHVSGVVFADKNDNGLRDADEGGLLGAVVHLMDETGDVATRTIGADGSFLFDAVLPGTYRLRYELPGDGVFAPLTDGGNTIAPDSDGTTDSFTIGVGEEVTAPLCGALALGDIEGMVFADHNGNGAQDADEAALAGVTLILTPSREDLTEQTVLTDATGAYSFTGLRPDAYTLTLRFPEGMVLSKLGGNVTLPLMHGLNEQQVSIEIGLGEEWLNQALGGVIPSKMSGQVWVDENDNGRMDAGEITPENETLTLLDETGAVFAQVQTDAEGRFAIDGIAPGVYSLAYDLKEGTQAARLGDSTFTTEGSQLVMTEIEISENNNYTAPMLGLKIDTSIGGMVWCDNAGEIAPLSGAEVILLDEKGSELQNATTGEDGLYRFDGLMPGNYRLRVTLPNGYVVVEKDDTRLKDGENISVMTTYTAREGESDLIALRMSQHQLEQNIGAVQPGTLGDFCWLDLNGNGLQDAGELGLGDMRIELWRNDQLVAETTTDAYGYYTFENLYPGVYTLKPIYPAEVVPTRLRTDIPLIASILGENGESNPVQVTSASTTYTADLGFVLVDDDVLPANYGIGEKQDWTKK
jgi:conserved repeat domain protein